MFIFANIKNNLRDMFELTKKIEKMRQLKIKGESFLFDVIFDFDLYAEYYETIFYKEMKEVKYKKWLFFGPVLTREEPIVLFSVYINITDKSYTKSEVKAIVEKEYDKYIGLLDREDEVRNGDYI